MAGKSLELETCSNLAFANGLVLVQIWLGLKMEIPIDLSI